MVTRAINLVIVNVGFVCNTYSLYGCWTTKNCDMDDQSELLIIYSLICRTYINRSVHMKYWVIF